MGQSLLLGGSVLQRAATALGLCQVLQSGTSITCYYKARQELLQREAAIKN